MEDIDLYRAAAEMVKKHGENAGIEAAMKSDNLLERGDMTGASVWRRIHKIIGDLQSQKTEGKTRH